ncbi:hypothetical protein QQP08_000884 [Theobroma cacao]|nr:hypothetical protein QQP08_000884 [Theobroma cacao]
MIYSYLTTTVFTPFSALLTQFSIQSRTIDCCFTHILSRRAVRTSSLWSPSPSVQNFDLLLQS